MGSGPAAGGISCPACCAARGAARRTAPRPRIILHRIGTITLCEFDAAPRRRVSVLVGLRARGMHVARGRCGGRLLLRLRLGLRLGSALVVMLGFLGFGLQDLLLVGS